MCRTSSRKAGTRGSPSRTAFFLLRYGFLNIEGQLHLKDGINISTHLWVVRVPESPRNCAASEGPQGHPISYVFKYRENTLPVENSLLRLDQRC